jgi:hypothetical protein
MENDLLSISAYGVSIITAIYSFYKYKTIESQLKEHKFQISEQLKVEDFEPEPTPEPVIEITPVIEQEPLIAYSTFQNAEPTEPDAIKSLLTNKAGVKALMDILQLIKLDFPDFEDIADDKKEKPESLI